MLEGLNDLKKVSHFKIEVALRFSDLMANFKQRSTLILDPLNKIAGKNCAKPTFSTTQLIY
jgi:hypothetical protein